MAVVVKVWKVLGQVVVMKVWKTLGQVVVVSEVAVVMKTG